MLSVTDPVYMKGSHLLSQKQIKSKGIWEIKLKRESDKDNPNKQRHIPINYSRANPTSSQKDISASILSASTILSSDLYCYTNDMVSFCHLIIKIRLGKS